MSARPITLKELFGEFAALWPRDRLRETPGIELGEPALIDLWLDGLNNGLKLKNVRFGSLDGRVALEADAAFDAGVAGYSDGFPMVIGTMPDVEFRLLPMNTETESFKLFVSVDAAGAPEVLIEGAPVQIALPIGLVEPHPGPADHLSGLVEKIVGEFDGKPDDLKIHYKTGFYSLILVHMRIHMTGDGDISLRPAVPISFGPCLFSGIPCLAVHDFSLIPSPRLIPRTIDWVRHKDLPKTDTGAPDIAIDGGVDGGAFGVRAIHLDLTTPPLKNVSDWLKGSADKKLPSEVVLDDLLVPFLGVPRHLTAGIRRGVVDPKDPKQTFFFDKAPVLIHFSRDPPFGVRIESFFVRIPDLEEPSDEDSPTVKGVTIAATLFREIPEGAAEDPKPMTPRVLEFALGENITPRMIYRRAFDPQTGLPVSGEGAARGVNLLLHHEIVGNSIDVMGFKAGLSLEKFTSRELDPFDVFPGGAEAAIDLFVSTPPSGEDDSFFRLRGLDGEKIAFAIEGLGWHQGRFGLAAGTGPPQLPDGVAAHFGPVKIIIQEIGLLADQGATYLSITAGVDTPLPKGLRGSIVLKRARFKVRGDAEAPAFLLDGFFVSLYAEGLLIDAGGYYSELTEGEVTRREFGLSGRVELQIGAVTHGLALDLLIGSVKSPSEKFRYFMVQALYRSLIVATWEVRNIRLLFANNLQPKLQPADTAAGELRFYNWHRQTNPLLVPGDRRLSGWKPVNDAWTIGIGAGASLPALGKVCELNVFILLTGGEAEAGGMFSGELTFLSNPKPVGYFVIEADNRTDRISMLIGVDFKIANFLSDPPEWCRDMAELAGTLLIANKPSTIALGRIADQRTWLSLQFDVKFLGLQSIFRFAACYERTEGGSSGFGMIISVEGGIKCGSKFQFSFLARLALLSASLSTGSGDNASTMTVELAGRVALFRILRFGLSMLAELRYLGPKPARTEMMLRFRFETPWYLPDFSWTLDCSSGAADPGAMATAVCPLRTASAIEGPELANSPLHLARFAPVDPAFDPDWDGSGAAPTFSVRQFGGPPTPEADRLASFAADAKVHPISIDSTIAIDWNVSVNDQLSLATDLAPGLGNQSSGELDLTYDLVAIKVRRRARYGDDRPWRDLDQIEELPADFTDPNGVGLSGEYAPQTLAKAWDEDLRVGGRTGTKRLLINAATPFSFTTVDNETDEQTVANNPNWPCCPPPDKGERYATHIVEFREATPGSRIVGERVFTESESRLALLRPAIARPAQAGSLPAGAIVGFLATATPGPFLRAEFDRAAASCKLRMAWGRALGVMELVGFDAAGEIVARKSIQLGGASPGFQEITLTPTGEMRRMEVRRLVPPGEDAPIGTTIDLPALRTLAVEIDRVSYVALDDYLNDLRNELACLGIGGGGVNGYSGHGKLCFLPNHEYEVAVTTRLKIAHPSKPSETAMVTEHVHFVTKGLPGLNAAPRTGAEVEPYVASAYGGGSGQLYREEPACLAFTENFLVATPLNSRSPGSSEERTTLHQLQLLVEPNIALQPETVFTATAADWIVDHRVTTMPPTRFDWKSRVTASLVEATPMVSRDPFKLRLARLTQLSRATCALPDPRDVTGSVLIAPPQGDPHPEAPEREIWAPGKGMIATARAKGAPFVDRRPFAAEDLSAFTFATGTGPGGGSRWSVDTGLLTLAGGPGRALAIFGDFDWNHFCVRVEVRCQRRAGLAVGLRQSSGAEGLFAMLDRIGAGVDLIIIGRSPGGPDVELARKPVANAPDPDTGIMLSVEAFDDRLRATALDTVVEVDRNAVREGRAALVGEGANAFASLIVHGIDIYRFAFATSRFISFADHIASFNGTIDTARPDDIGVGSTTEAVSALWAATRSEIAAVMQPEAAAAARQSLFDTWITGLGLPLRQEVRKLALTKFVAAAQAELILLETPEPLDFMREVKVELARIDPQPQPPVLPLPGDLFERERPGRTGVPAPRRKPIILSVAGIGNGYRIELDATVLNNVPQDIVVVRRAAGEFIFYRGRLPRITRLSRTVSVTVRRDSTLPDTGATPPLPILTLLKAMPADALALLNAELSTVIDVFMPPRPQPPIELAILQDAIGGRALLIPRRGENAAPIEAGRYELRFSMDRERWPTTASPNADNRYRDDMTLSIVL